MRITTLLLACCVLLATGLSAQLSDQLPDKLEPDFGTDVFGQLKMNSPGITDPPNSPVRAMAEWEELQAIAIAYNRSDWEEGHLQALRDIAREASEEVEVIVICQLERDQDDFIADSIDISNITFIPVGLNSVEEIWIRDYGPHTLYTHDIDSMLLVDWIYEPDAPTIDTVASYEMAGYFEIPLYLTTEAPLNLRMDGGNFLTDGVGTAFSSKLVLTDNDNNEDLVDQIMHDFMGIERYIKFDELNYDVIHHIDMHMKLLDEETILVGQYPEGISDYGIIESNIAYLQDNFVSPFGTPYKIKRILMPPDENGQYPEGENTSSYCSVTEFSACYNTYTNALFVNRKILVPTYEMPEYDDQALEVWQNLMPGYEIVGINCKEVIPYFGAVHCISKEIGSSDPLLIVHQKIDKACLTDNKYRFEAEVKHRSGIEKVTLFYKTDPDAVYQPVPMEILTEDIWEVELDAMPEETTVYYYIETKSNSGKQMRRPIAAPDAYWSFEVENCLSTDVENAFSEAIELKTPFPNPGQGQIWIPVESPTAQHISLTLHDLLGRELVRVFAGKTGDGLNRYSLDARNLPSGTYFVQLQTVESHQVKKIVIE